MRALPSLPCSPTPPSEVNPGGLNVSQAAPLGPQENCQNLEEVFRSAVSLLLEGLLTLSNH